MNEVAFRASASLSFLSPLFLSQSRAQTVALRQMIVGFSSPAGSPVTGLLYLAVYSVWSV